MLGWARGGHICDGLDLARIDICVSGLNSGYMARFDLGGGRVYRGLPIAGESGKQRLRAVVRNRRLL